jgi:hypothetical protein
MLFGLICVEDPSNQMFGENCFNFWEQPIVHYRSLGECDRAGKAIAIQIRRELERFKHSIASTRSNFGV